MPLLIIHFIIIILFYAKNFYKKIGEKIKDISYGIKNWDLVKEEEREKKRQERLRKMQKRKEQLKKLKKEKEKKEKKKEKKEKEKDKKENDIYKRYNIEPPLYLKYREIMGLSNIARPVYIQYKNYINEINLNNEPNSPVKKPRKNNSINKINDNNKRNILNINSKGKENISKLPDSISQLNRPINSTEKKNKALKKTKEIMAYNDEELNNLKYELALKYDHRTYCEYYISLLKTKHIMIFTFFNNTDYNSKLIKIDLLLFNFSLYYAVNTLFFNDNTMHQIYEDEGSFNFVYQLPQIAYSSLISAVINILLKMLALSQGLILDFKQKKEKKDLEGREKSLEDKIKVKFILYFLFSTILLLFFWYYISMFCAIYVNTQIHLIKDTLISFGLSLFYPFGINLIPGIFRIPSLSNNKNKKSYLYNLSKIFQMI